MKGKTRTDADDIKKQSVNLGYNFNDRLSLAYNYYESQVNYERIFVDVERVMRKPMISLMVDYIQQNKITFN